MRINLQQAIALMSTYSVQIGEGDWTRMSPVNKMRVIGIAMGDMQEFQAGVRAAAQQAIVDAQNALMELDVAFPLQAQPET